MSECEDFGRHYDTSLSLNYQVNNTILAGCGTYNVLNASPYAGGMDATCVDLHVVRGLPSVTFLPLTKKLSAMFLHKFDATPIR